MNKITLTTLKWAPPFAQGVVRDLRVRWALNECGIPYEEHLVSFKDKATSDYKTLQPFAQVPVYKEGDLVLFESGSIVLHIAEKSDVLLPADAHSRARAKTWMFAALNSVELPIQNLAIIDFFSAGEEWANLRRPAAEEQVKARLQSLSDWLGEREYLEGEFTAGDLLMCTVLRILRHTDLLQLFPNLEAYKQRCEARPAFQKALAAQMDVFARNTPPST